MGFALDYRQLNRNDFGSSPFRQLICPRVKKEIELEIGHVLFIDIVAYSKLSVDEQHARIEELNEIVRSLKVYVLISEDHSKEKKMARRGVWIVG